MSTPTTKRKLSLDDLLAHLKHHNAGVRKGKHAKDSSLYRTAPKSWILADAVLGLRELLDEFPSLLESKLLTLVNATVRLITDEV